MCPSNAVNDHRRPNVHIPSTTNENEGNKIFPFKPGMVEVQFEEGFYPEINSSTNTSSRFEINSRKNTDLSDLNELLSKFQLQNAELTFEISGEEADKARKAAQKRRINAPNLRNFITLHFLPTADIVNIAYQLR